MARDFKKNEIVEYFNEEKGEMNLFSDIESKYLEWDKPKRKGEHLK